jgi:hypothetical protein
MKGGKIALPSVNQLILRTGVLVVVTWIYVIDAFHTQYMARLEVLALGTTFRL